MVDDRAGEGISPEVIVRDFFVGIEINRLDRGKIADSWAISDADGLRWQLDEQ